MLYLGEWEQFGKLAKKKQLSQHIKTVIRTFKITRIFEIFSRDRSTALRNNIIIYNTFEQLHIYKCDF